MQFQDSHFTKGINYDTTAPHKSFLTCIWHTKATSLDKNILVKAGLKIFLKFLHLVFYLYYIPENNFQIHIYSFPVI